ncbi:MAG: ECF transporter S component [Candidatus Heimdallarchaeaceae archaeon]
MSVNEEISLSDKMTKEVNSIRSLALIVTFTGLVFLSTSIFYLNIASSTGFFNIGEAFVYIAALVGGPITGAISGGIGSALADLALGYGIYAPATLVLKAAEGFVVGYLFHKSKKFKKWIKYAIICTLCVFLIVFSSFFVTDIFTVETTFYGASGSHFSIATLTLANLDTSNFMFRESFKVFALDVPGYVLLILAVVLSALMLLAIFKFGEKGEMALSCSLAGMIIVIGYFLYQAFIIGVGAAGAAIEIPFNIAQVFFGAAIAIPLVSYLRDLGILSSKDDTEATDLELEAEE